MQDYVQKKQIRDKLTLTPLGNSNLTNNSNGDYGTSILVTPDREGNILRDSNSYQESLGKILVSLKEKSSTYELLLADLFTRVL